VPRTTAAILAAKEILVKKYVVRLSGGERDELATLIRKGSSLAQRLMKAQILLKADISEAGEGWSDTQIIEALETSPSMVYRGRKQLVEEGFEAVLSRKPRAGLRFPGFSMARGSVSNFVCGAGLTLMPRRTCLRR
jgi:Homeodomain-like domain